MANVLAHLSSILIPAVIFFIIGYGWIHKCNLYDDFINGAADGLKTVVGIVPTLIGLMMAVGILRGSGLLDLPGKLLQKYAADSSISGMFPEFFPLIFIRLFSSSAATGLVLDIFKTYGTDSLAGRDSEWVPIRPGTDAALAAGMAYVMITENLVDQKFLDTYCIGYDEKTLPKSAPKGSDYKSYILGKGADKTPKTPLWASRITNVPVETIERLAKEIATTKPCFISQGWGPQRRMNGETQSTSIAMLALLTGQVGLPGTNTGAREGDSYGIDTGLPTGKNPVKVSFPIFLWPKAVIDAKSMTSKNAAVRGADHLSHNIKFIWNTQGNTLINQHLSLIHI